MKKKKILTFTLQLKKNKKNLNFFYIGQISESKRNKLKKKYINFTFVNEPVDFSSKTKILNHYNFCENIYKKVMETLYVNLNQLHEVNISKKQWQIILGEWLTQFIYIVYYNYQKLKKAVNSDKYEKILYSFTKDNYDPVDLIHLVKFSNDLEWNERINGQIVDFLSLKKKKLRLKKIKKKIIVSKISSKKKLLFKLQKYYRFFQRDSEPLIQNTCLKFLDERKLEYKLGLIPKKRFFPNENFSTKIDIELRKKIKLTALSNSKSFYQLILYLIPYYIPRMSVENFKLIFNNLKNIQLQSNPKYILTSYNFFYDHFNFYISEKAKKKIPIIFLQHGNISSLDITYKFTTENKIADILLTWGHKHFKKDLKLFNVNSMRFKIRNLNKNKINVICHPLRQHARFSDISQSIVNENKLNYTIENFKLLDKNIKDKIYFKLFPSDPLSEKKYFEQKLKTNGFKILEKTSFNKAINSSKLNLFLYMSTGIYECLALNIPTISFIEKPLKNIVPKYKKVFKKLVDSNIIFDDINKLNNHLKNIWPDIDIWWNNKKLQKNIKYFNKKVNINLNNNIENIAINLRKLENKYEFYK